MVRWLDDQMAGWPEDRMARSPDDWMARRRYGQKSRWHIKQCGLFWIKKVMFSICSYLFSSFLKAKDLKCLLVLSMASFK